MDDCDRMRRVNQIDILEWLKLHYDHGGIHDITALTDPPYMIRRMCYCGSKHIGLREGTYL